MVKHKYYAVYNGREGIQIYLTWDETKANVSRVSGVKYKSFHTLAEAQAWLQGLEDSAVPASQWSAVQQANAWQHQARIGPSDQGPQHLNGYDEDEEDFYAGGVGLRSQAMQIDEDDGIKILPPPFGAEHAGYEAYELDDDDVEILSGPPPNWHQPHAGSRGGSRTPQEAAPAAAAAGPQQLGPPAPLPPPHGAGAGADDRAVAPEGMLVAGPVHEIELSPDQLYVLAKVKNGESVFFTGSAGTGKSVLLREIIKYCGERPSRALGVTASTGIASVNIGGCTLHSWAGIGLGKDDKDNLVGKIYGLARNAYKKDKKRREDLRRRRANGEWLSDEDYEFLKKPPEETRKSKILDRWRQVKTLIIDEISMIDGKLFDKLEYIARQLRKNELPFGGIQLVLSGDFCQLPPVPDKDAKGGQIPACFAFDAESWPRCVGRPIILRKVFRQKDQNFVDMLNQMRFGRLDPLTTAAFRQLERPVHYDDGIQPTELYPTRKEVEAANSARLAKLDGAPKPYIARDAPGRDENGNEFPRDRVERGLNDLVAPKALPLKVGAQVMLIKNIIQGVLVNGSVGRVVGFYKPREAVAMGAQVALPDARDVHVQGTPAASQEPAPAGAPPEHSQLQRAQNDQREQRLKIIMSLNTVWPAVQFPSGELMLCVPLTFEVINADGNIEAVRDQVPLILAWALSIHKSQGQTLERVRVNLNNIFEKGQAYVALSRATRMETLQVLNFDPSKVRAHPRVLEWMAEHADKAPDTTDTRRDEIDEELEYWQDVLDL